MYSVPQLLEIHLSLFSHCNAPLVFPNNHSSGMKKEKKKMGFQEIYLHPSLKNQSLQLVLCCKVLEYISGPKFLKNSSFGDCQLFL